jgi:ABC-type multidrug transport system ATPase subunit/ABC-type multidrug transport system permease subunit
MAKLFCPNCGGENLPEAQFCRHCGAPTILAAPAPKRTEPQSTRSWVVGSAPDNDIVISKATVSRKHCRLTVAGDGFVIEDLGSRNGTYVNGHRITAPTSIKRTDQVTLGVTEPLVWPQVGPASVAEIHPISPDSEAKTAVTADVRQSRMKTTASDAIAAQVASPPAGAAPASGAPRVITIGRIPGNDIVLDYPMISSRHARITISNGQAVIEDLGSTNGTAIGRPENRIQRSVLNEHDVVYFGSFRIPAARLLGGHLQLGEMASTVAFEGTTMVFGRDPSADRVLDYPMVSWRHMQLRRVGGDMLVEDLGSTNGTYVNGVRIAGPVRVRPGDVVGLGSYTFTIAPDGGLEERDLRGNLTIEVYGLSVDVPGKKLLGNISLVIYPSEFVGLMGPSGAGKTTLMMAMNGYVPPTAGHVLLNGMDLYANYGQFCGHLGYVPQNDIMHGDLTVRQALYYTARLRLPSDYSSRDINQRVDLVLGQLGLDAVQDVLIGSPEKKGISGGQRKRVNLAMELLTDPSVLFLDEPTSGLSSEDTLMVMRLLRELADSGKTILLTIHQPSLEAYRLMDHVTIVSKDKGSAEPGCLAYFGPAYPDSVKFFNPSGIEGLKPGHDPSPDEVLRGLAKGRSADWGRAYQASEYRRKYIDERMGRRSLQMQHAVSPKIPRRGGIRQWWTLVRRALAIKMRDRWNTAILLVQAPIIAALIVFVFGDKVSSPAVTGDSFEKWTTFASSTATTLFLMAISAIWFGCSNSAREIVGEWAIYHRERMVNLKIPSYVISKFTVLGTLCSVQCGILLGIVYSGCELRGDPVIMFLLLYLASLVGLGLGLTVSSLAKTSEVAIALLPLILIPMVIAGGSMRPVHNLSVPMQIFAGTMASRWAFEGLVVLEADARPLWEPTLPKGAPPGARLPADAPKKQDIAEHYFPADDDRWGVVVPLVCLSVMFWALFCLILIILRMRDVH